jgi:hypothetical protein
MASERPAIGCSVDWLLPYPWSNLSKVEIPEPTDVSGRRLDD